MIDYISIFAASIFSMSRKIGSLMIEIDGVSVVAYFRKFVSLFRSVVDLNNGWMKRS